MLYLSVSRIIPKPTMKWTFSKLVLSPPGPAASRRDCVYDALRPRKISSISRIASLNTICNNKIILTKNYFSTSTPFPGQFQKFPSEFQIIQVNFKSFQMNFR